MTSKTKLQKHIYRAIEQLQHDYQTGVFAPILEADIVFYLAHLLLKGRSVRPEDLHLDTRIAGTTSGKADLAIGKPVYLRFGKETRRGVDADAVVEVKFLGVDRPQGEHNIQLKAVREDIQNLGRTKQKRGKGVYVVLAVDEASYFQKPVKQKSMAALYNVAEETGVLLRVLSLAPPPTRPHRTVHFGGYKLVAGQMLYGYANGKEHVATITSEGLLAYGAQEFESPSAAGRAITRRSSDGPGFWGLADRSKKKSKKSSRKDEPKLAKYVKSAFPIRHTFSDGRVAKANVLRDGTIRRENQVFTSPTGAAKAEVKRPVDGWLFWRYRNKAGEWVQLDKLRR